MISNGGHTWPQGYQYLPKSIVGKTSQDMNASEVIWTFFKRFKR
jgi:polyhydroxybutyrate depolymerase